MLNPQLKLSIAPPVCHCSMLKSSVLLCRLVLFAIPACVVGVALITQPSFLGFSKSQQRNLWGVVFASSQVTIRSVQFPLLSWTFGACWTMLCHRVCLATSRLPKLRALSS